MSEHKSINPYTGQTIKIHEYISDAEIAEKLMSATQASMLWKQKSFQERAGHFHKLAQLMRDRQKELAELMTQEMGKPITQALLEIEKCAWCCEFYAENAEKFLQPETVKLESQREAWVQFQPLGVVLAIMPWNFPFWQVIRFAAPSLMAGNVGLLKHASNVSMCSFALEKLFKDSGFPAGVFQSLLVPSDKVASLIASPQIHAVTLTGSTAAGRSVAANAGKNIKKVVLELGGSDPSIILEDADLKLAAKMCAKGRLQNSGQSCIAAKRFLVHEKVHAEFLENLKTEFTEYKMGDPMDKKTGIGTQANRKLRDELHDQVKRSIAAGAKLILGGEIPDGEAAFYPPTILDKVKPGQAAFDEEIFGPVAAVSTFSSMAEAIELANASNYGLGASVYTRDMAMAKTLATQIESGSVFINDFVKSDPRLPFGGIKESGLGRELSHYGIKEFVNIKTVSVTR